MGLHLQFVAPVAVVLFVASTGWLLGYTIVGLIVGIALAVVLAWLLARNAVQRLNDLAGIPERSSALVYPLLEATGTLDEIDETHSILARWLVSERQATVQKQAQTERQIRMLDRLSDGVLLVAEDSLVIYANVAAASLLGGRNPVGSSFIAAVRDHEAAESLVESLTYGTEARRNIEVPGEDRVVDAIIARVSSSPPEAVVVMRDVTELIRLQTLRRDFVANVSHELRTPLSTVKILTETIIDLDASPPEQLQFLERIEGEVDSMAALVDDLLQLTQLESGRTPLSRQDIDAVELLGDVEERMRPIADRQQVELESGASCGQIGLVADDRRIKQALINLVANAIAHTRPGGSVSLFATQDSGSVRFTVSDTGVGIPVEDLDRIWERFYKVDRSRALPGTGLGLAIVKHVVQAHGGTVSVESSIGQGSTFEIRIPVDSRLVV